MAGDNAGGPVTVGSEELNGAISSMVDSVQGNTDSIISLINDMADNGKLDENHPLGKIEVKAGDLGAASAIPITVGIQDLTNTAGLGADTVGKISQLQTAVSRAVKGG